MISRMGRKRLIKAGKAKTAGEMHAADSPKRLRRAKKSVTGINMSERKKQSARLAGVVYFLLFSRRLESSSM